MIFYYTYVLYSLKDNQLYIGYTTDVFERLKQHNNGESLSTKSRIPFKLIYYEAHLSKNDAIRRERYFKTSPGKRTLNQMLRSTLKHLK
ncbi:MAG: GIY-YIG nuclease family protein [Saprospiraceae bacterium]|nr:GIY-YIG nuclease family protein [Saprospiraceae bacterium]